jgi:hypothetical protein
MAPGGLRRRPSRRRDGTGRRVCVNSASLGLAVSLFGHRGRQASACRGAAGTALSRGVEAPVCLRRLVFMIRRVRKINIGRYLDREPGLPISGNHPRLTFWAAGDRHQEGPLTADDQHECVGTEMGREDLGVGDHDRFRAVLLITLRRWT